MTDCFRKLLQVLENPSRHLQPSLLNSNSQAPNVLPSNAQAARNLNLEHKPIDNIIFSPTLRFSKTQAVQQQQQNNRPIDCFQGLLQVFEGPSRHQQPKPYRTARRAPIALPQRLKLTTTTIPCTDATPAVFVEPPTASDNITLRINTATFTSPG